MAATGGASGLLGEPAGPSRADGGPGPETVPGNLEARGRPAKTRGTTPAAAPPCRSPPFLLRSRHMSKWSQRVPALLALVVSLAPCTNGAFAVAHSMISDGHAPMSHVAEIEASLHGHAHQYGTPSHSHRFTAAVPPCAPAPVFAMEHMHPASPSVVRPPFAAGLSAAGVAARPLPSESPPTALPILRV